MSVNRILMWVLLAMISCASLGAQESSDASSVEESTEGEIDVVNSTWLAPVITDEMTRDPEQNRQWRLGQYKYSAKPKNMWELGIHFGHFFIDGDVDRKIFGGYGFGAHLRKALNYFTSIRLDGYYGKASGLETQPWRNRSVGGGLVESNEQFSGWDAYDPNSGGADGWFPAYSTTYYYGTVQVLFNLSNLLFHQERNKWSFHTALGFGFDHHSTMLDLLDGNDQPYEDLIARTGFTREFFNTKAGRDAIKSELKSIYDGEYETEGFKKEGIFRLGDDYNIHGVFTASLGLSRKISRRFNIGFEHQMMLSDNDYLDGIKFRTASDQSNNVDVAHYTNIRLGFNLGNFSKRTEPLYWLNPLENIYSDLAEVKSRPNFEWVDTDDDGVMDLIDLEPDTPEGCLVDTKGVTLDSDGDGIADCQDREPFSPPGYPIDQFGVAQIEEPVILTEDDVIRIISENCDLCANKGYGVTQIDPNTGRPYPTVSPTGEPVENVDNVPPGSTVNSYGTIVNTGCGNWFLPMLHFDLDKYAIRPESYPKLHQIATVMRLCPDICVTAHGHTDTRNSNNYNEVLSYNRAKEAIDYLVSSYGIDRSRFKLMFGGEESPLIPNLKSHHYTNEEEELAQFINRRVEFRLCEVGDVDMPRPEGREAGVRSLGSSRPGSKYKGNKNTQY